MAHDYAYSLASDGSKDFTTYAALDTQMVTDWGTDNFDADVVVTVYHVAAFTGIWTVTPTLNPTTSFPLRIEAAAGHSPVIDATGNANGVYMNYQLLHVRLKGIEVHSATVNNIYARARLTYMENVYSHDCAADLDYLLYSYAPAIQMYNCRFEGTGRIAFQLAGVLAQRCSFSGGDVSDHIIAAYFFGYNNFMKFEACKFDGSSLNAGQPIIELIGVAGGDDYPHLEFLNCTVYDGGWFVGQKNAGREAPVSLRAINNIFVDQDTGVFDFDGDIAHQDEGNIYELEANCFFNCGNYLIDNAGTYANLGQLQAAGYDTLTASIDTDPDETNPFDGTIPNDSSCIEAGIGAGVLIDYFGNSYRMKTGVPSIGCDGQWDREVASPTFAGATSLTNNPNGTFTLVFPQATGVGADFYSVHIHTASMNAAAWNARTYLMGAVDDTGAGTYTCIIGENAQLAAKLTLDTLYYVAVRAHKGALQDAGAVNKSKMVTNPWAAAGYSWTPESVAVVQLGTSETTLFTCPAGNGALCALLINNIDSVAHTYDIHFRKGAVAAADANAILGPDEDIQAKNVAGDKASVGTLTMEPTDIVSGKNTTPTAAKINVLVGILLNGTP